MKPLVFHALTIVPAVLLGGSFLWFTASEANERKEELAATCTALGSMDVKRCRTALEKFVVQLSAPTPDSLTKCSFLGVKDMSVCMAHVDKLVKP